MVTRLWQRPCDGVLVICSAAVHQLLVRIKNKYFCGRPWSKYSGNGLVTVDDVAAVQSSRCNDAAGIGDGIGLDRVDVDKVDALGAELIFKLGNIRELALCDRAGCACVGYDEAFGTCELA